VNALLLGPLGLALGLALGLGLAAVVLRRGFVVVTVFGLSMRPTYADGDRVLMLRSRTLARRRGAVIVFTLPGPDRVDLLIKRVVARAGDATPAGVRRAAPGQPVPAGHLVVFGDSLGSDSRVWGYLPVARVRGVVVGRLHESTSPGSSARTV
jgi:signal peptidase I